MDDQQYFSRHDAERTLPLVKRIVADILETGRKLRTYLRHTAELRAHSAVMTGPVGAAADASAEASFADDRTIMEARAELEEYLAELEAMGCFFKDWNFEIGLIDFPAVIDNEKVFLCWRSDEDELGYYHRIRDGFAGRRPLPPEWTGNTIA